MQRSTSGAIAAARALDRGARSSLPPKGISRVERQTLHLGTSRTNIRIELCNVANVMLQLQPRGLEEPPELLLHGCVLGRRAVDPKSHTITIHHHHHHPRCRCRTTHARAEPQSQSDQDV